MNNEIKQIEQYARKNLSDLNWFHTKGVRLIAHNLSEKEKGDKRIIDIAVLLHDIAKDKKSLLSHAQSGSSVAKKLLKELKYDKKFINQVVHCIKSHSSPWAKNGPMPKSIEAKIVFDADMVQQLSPLGIVKHILKYKNRNFQNLIILAKKDLLNINNIILTTNGKKMAAKRIKYIKNFFNTFKF